MTTRRTPVWLLIALLLVASPAIGQPPPSPDDNAPPSPFQFSVPGLGNQDDGPQLFLDASFDLEEGTRTGRLHVTARPAAGWHTYSMTQPPGGPQPSKLTLAKSAEYKLLGPFTPDHAPDAKPSAEFFEDPLTRKKPITVEEHHEPVTWTAPIELADNVDPQQLTIGVKYSGQVCKTSCIPVNENRKQPLAVSSKSPKPQASSPPRANTSRGKRTSSRRSPRRGAR
jgi:hypothetical protein